MSDEVVGEKDAAVVAHGARITWADASSDSECGQSPVCDGNDEDNAGNNSGEDTQLDPALESFVDAIITAKTGTSVEESKVAAKRARNALIRARVAPAEAKSEAFTVLRALSAYQA